MENQPKIKTEFLRVQDKFKKAGWLDRTEILWLLETLGKMLN